MNKYTIILPVRNGSNHIEECIRSILSQSFKGFDLVILENCSTDNTKTIIDSFHDSRIKVYPADKSLTIEENWQRILTIDKGEFITLTGHDDVFDENYLLCMDELISMHPTASLYQAHFRYIDSHGKEIGKCQRMGEIQNTAEVIHNFLYNKIDLMGTGFMMRSKDYSAVGGIPPYPNLLFADMELWIRLAQKGYLVVDTREAFSYRKHLNATTSTSSDANFLQAFDQLVKYLVNLKTTDPALAPLIVKDSVELFRQYCQGITHKVLRTPRNYRKVPSVSEIIDHFREYGKQMGNDFEPLDYKKIRIGEVIDNNLLLHASFLLLKKIYSKPVLKN